MPTGKPISVETKEQIAQLLREGNSRYAVAKKLQIDSKTVSAHGIAMGIIHHRSPSKALILAVQARSYYDALERSRDILLLRERWQKELGKSTLDSIQAKALRDLAVTLGITIDKQRLEEGLSSINVASRATVEYETTAEQRSAIRAALLGADHARLPPASE